MITVFIASVTTKFCFRSTPTPLSIDWTCRRQAKANRSTFDRNETIVLNTSAAKSKIATPIMSRCDLYLENYQDHYIGGQTIIGHVQCTFTEEKTVNGIFVRVQGEASTHWTVLESHYDSLQKKNVSRTVHYHGSESFISHQIDLLNNHGNSVSIGEGVHKYQFSFTLPLDLPSTFKASLGKIVYSIKAVVERPMFKFNYEAEAIFNIVTPLDLNRDITLRDPATRNKDKSLAWLCWSKGNITAEMKIPFTGFAIGQQLPIHISAENMSQASIERIECKVRKLLEFKCTTPRSRTRHSSDTIFTDSYTGIGAHGMNIYDKIILISNASLCTNLWNCNIIKQTYELEVTFILPCPHRNIVLTIPVMVGNIAIGNVGPPIPSPPAYNLGFNNVEQTTSQAPYGFTDLQPPYNPNVVSVPPPYSDMNVGGFQAGFQLPARTPSAPPKDVLSNDTSVPNQDLPTYDQAMLFAKQEPAHQKY